jgi:ABC-type transport system substrate-binding protein
MDFGERWQKGRVLCGILLKAFCFLLFCCIVTSCDYRDKSENGKVKPTVQVPQPGGIYRIPLFNNPKVLDPARAEDQYSDAVVYQLFDGLVRFSPDLLIIPALAENWRIEQDGLVYRFFLRGNACFHNGRPITPRDVVFSFSRLIRTDPAPSILPHMLRIVGAREYRSGRSDHLEGMQILGDHELRIILEEPYAPFLVALGMHQTRIVPEEEVVKEGSEFFRNPVGSGAFRFISWEDNKSVCLGRFPEYYLGAALLDEIRYVIYPGGRIEDVLVDFQEGRLDEMPVYGKIREKLPVDKGIKWIHRPSLSLLFYGVNCENPSLSRPELRKVLSAAIDREKLVSTVYEGRFEPAGSLLPPGILGYRPRESMEDVNLGETQRDPRQVVREVLGENPTLEVVSAIQSPVAKAELDFIAQCWGKLGITLKTKFISDWSEFEKYVKSPSMQIYRYAWSMDIPDPDNILQVLFGSDSDVNYMHYRNPEVDRRLRSARIMMQPEDRGTLYQSIESLIVQASPVIPLAHLTIDQVYQSNVQGIELNALGGHKSSLRQVWLSH